MILSEPPDRSIMGKLRIEQKIVGMVSTNVYLGINTETGEAFMVDPADKAELLKDWLKEKEVTLKAILLTHGHFDHIGAVMQLKRDLQVPVYAMTSEKTVLDDAMLNLSGSWGAPFTVQADRLLSDGQSFAAAGFEITAYHTPGHTKGGVCYYIQDEKTLFSGDTIFCESIGRTDFPTGNFAELVRSVKRVLADLPDDVKIYPGHEESTDVAHEKKYNPYL